MTVNCILIFSSLPGKRGAKFKSACVMVTICYIVLVFVKYIVRAVVFALKFYVAVTNVKS